MKSLHFSLFFSIIHSYFNFLNFSFYFFFSVFSFSIFSFSFFNSFFFLVYVHFRYFLSSKFSSSIILLCLFSFLFFFLLFFFFFFFFFHFDLHHSALDSPFKTNIKVSFNSLIRLTAFRSSPSKMKLGKKFWSDNNPSGRYDFFQTDFYQSVV